MADLKSFWCSGCVYAAISYSLHLILPLCIEASNDLRRQAEDSGQDGEGSGLLDNMTNSTSSTTSLPTNATTTESSSPVLSGSAIANIICGALAIIFLTSYLCYLMYTFNQQEHKSRVRTALENNRRIDEQIARAKARAAARQRSQETAEVVRESDESQSELLGSPEPVVKSVDCTTPTIDPGLDFRSTVTAGSNNSGENSEALRT